MSSTRTEPLLDGVQAASDRRPSDIECGLDVSDAALHQPRKACRLLAGAAALQEQGHYTLVIAASVARRRETRDGPLRRAVSRPY